MNSRFLLAAALLAWPGVAAAQAPGFATERYVASSPGAGWFVMDDLRMKGGLGGALALGLGYSHDALRLHGDDNRDFSVVRDQAFAEFGFAITYSRFRFTLDLSMPLAVSGHDGVAAGETYVAPHVSLQTNPDTLADPRLGVDVRLLGTPEGPLRLGASAQLIVPSAEPTEYLSDGTYRAMLRLLFAGDRGIATYAANLGVHIRPRSYSDIEEAPRGSELLFGAAGGVRLPASASSQLVVGPELWGETAFDEFFGKRTTGLEALIGARLEGTRPRGAQLRLKFGAGPGINEHFGVPEWRTVFGIEVFNRNSD